MLFPTFTFAVFFAVVLTAGWALHRRHGAWKLFMLAASYVFYGYWDWRFIGLLALSTVANQSFAHLVHRAGPSRAGRVGVGAAVAFNLALLGFFKYYGFFASSIAATFGRIGLPSPPLLHIVLPVAISFFTFQAISYVVDVRRGLVTPAPLLDFALFLSFFPQLVAGPIVRASEMLPQLRQPPDPRRIDLTGALVLIGMGLFKKVVVSSYLAGAIVDEVFTHPGRASSLELLVGAYGYAIQIYADFSGYTDIAIGVALLLGLRFPKNFDRPYAAASIQDFWRRWHMTLSRWLRDYLYIPLGGNRGGPEARDRNLLLTMVLGGLWHGAAWTFVVWGAYQGLGLAVERRLGARRGGRAPHPLVGKVITFHFICVGWIFFRADSLGDALHYLWRLAFAWGPAPLVTTPVLAVIVAALLAQHLPRGATANLSADASRLSPALQAAAFGAFLVLVDVLGPPGVSPFIYFQF